jgi:nitroreductase
MDSVLEAIKGRRSVREYERRPVPASLLQELVEVACWAPSGGNRQAWRFIIVTDEKRLRALRMVSPGLMGEPPAAIVVCEDVADSAGQSVGSNMRTFLSEDGPLAAYAITLAAYAKGLGTCIVASFNDAAVHRLLHLPAEIVPALIVAVGYAARVPEPPQRRAERVWFWQSYAEGEGDDG